MELQLEVVHQPEALQLAVEGFELQAIVLVTGPQFHDRLDLQLKHLHPRHRVAVVAGAQGHQLLWIEQGRHHPVFLAEIGGQAIVRIGDR